MIKAVIFDMDGVLIDSEPFWQRAEREVFGALGVQISDKEAEKTASMTTVEVTRYWFDQQPWTGRSLEKVENDVIDYVQNLVAKEGKPMEGLEDLLEFFTEKDFMIGLSTNSPRRIIPTILKKIGVIDYFDSISSSEDELKAKPDPSVYLSTARKLNVFPSNCIVFEDSGVGIKAAKNANMKVVALLPQEKFDDGKYKMADLKLSHFSDFSEEHLLALSHVKT
ncbi:hexitol phosphatase HxpB [Reichenbachiella sp. MALMAid0571]|uniref:hexitol phosphatase HxpB n=1 Tax=Reichenbachiella sp. MALMAid0571 TaxID=3143939 RepID=UPI0032DFE433